MFPKRLKICGDSIRASELLNHSLRLSVSLLQFSGESEDFSSKQPGGNRVHEGVRCFRKNVQGVRGGAFL